MQLHTRDKPQIYNEDAFHVSRAPCPFVTVGISTASVVLCVITPPPTLPVGAPRIQKMPSIDTDHLDGRILQRHANDFVVRKKKNTEYKWREQPSLHEDADPSTGRGNVRFAVVDGTERLHGLARRRRNELEAEIESVPVFGFLAVVVAALAIDL